MDATSHDAPPVAPQTPPTPPTPPTPASKRSGGGGMPSFSGQLSPAQIRDVAAFVAQNAGR